MCEFIAGRQRCNLMTDTVREKDSSVCVDDCMLPEKNTHYGVYLVYLLFCYFGLLQNNNSFTFASILMYLAPLFIDLLSIKAKAKTYMIFRRIFLWFNGIGLAFSGLGLLGFLVDNTTTFEVLQTAILFGELAVKKEIICWILLAEFAVPVILWFGRPTKEKCKVARNASN